MCTNSLTALVALVDNALLLTCVLLAGYKGAITALAYCPDKQQLLSFGYEGGLNMWTVAPLDTAAIVECSTAQTATSYGYTGITPLAVKHSNSTGNSRLQSLQRCIVNASISSDDVAVTSAHAWSASYLPFCSSSSVLVCMSNGELLQLDVAATTGRCSATVLLRAHAGRLSGLEPVPANGSANGSYSNGSEFVTVSKVSYM
jgi:hypothetical protein